MNQKDKFSAIPGSSSIPGPQPRDSRSSGGPSYARCRFLLVFACLVAMLAVGPAFAQVASSSVLANVPAVPGFPEGIAVRGNSVYVSGPANFGIFTPSEVSVFDRDTGALTNIFPVTVQPPFPFVPKGISAGNFGPDGAYYVPEPFMGAIIRMELDDANTQSVYAGGFPAPGGPGSSLLNDLAFDGAGYMYVTDSFLGRIYRVPPGGGAPQVWFEDARLLGDPLFPFGANGLRFDKNDQYLYVAVTAEPGTFDGVIYRLPRVASPLPGDLQEFHRYQFHGTFPIDLPDGPDGIAFAKSGALYVALAGASQISVLAPDGSESARYHGPAVNSKSGPSPMPWANPANIAFDLRGGAILFTNHASLVSPPDASLFSVIQMPVDDKGLPLP